MPSSRVDRTTSDAGRRPRAVDRTELRDVRAQRGTARDERATMRGVSALEDYLHCPALVGWLPDRLAGCWVAHEIAPGAPAVLRRLVRRWPLLESDADAAPRLNAPTRALVIAGTLRRPAPVELIGRLPAGAVLVEVATVGGLRLGERLLGLPARRSTRRITARRLSAWLDAGLADVEQWLTTEPADTCVTLGRTRATHPGRGD